MGKMEAAVTQDDGAMEKPTDESNSVPDADDRPAAESKHDDAQHDFVLDFVQKELGGDLKALKNVGELLEKVRAEKEMLEEQVNKQPPHLWETTASPPVCRVAPPVCRVAPPVCRVAPPPVCRVAPPVGRVDPRPGPTSSPHEECVDVVPPM